LLKKGLRRIKVVFEDFCWVNKKDDGGVKELIKKLREIGKKFGRKKYKNLKRLRLKK